jgi:acetyl/propionyl-CoA carboxylase alpha subunit
VVSAARSAGTDALHPGYGFLAENAAFAQAVIDAGIRWVGPPPNAILAMGDKAAARRLAASLGIPVLPGYDGDDQSDDVLTREAGRIGFPLLVKPSAGGGGKGMRAIDRPDSLAAGLAAARREARAAFGDDRVILERLLLGPRHVEIQLLFDGHGNGVHLGERDCSTQRRHQKVLEESPSPAVGPALRAAMGVAALQLAQAVGYSSVGTVEFLLDDSGKFFFLEMNTRLQVEHPVTELVTGLDLVEQQLRVAAGAALELRQSNVPLSGHAIEVRLYAEDADTGFLPAVGRVAALRWPEGPGIRVDAGIEPGDEVTGRFDPMLAKIVAHGSTRADALDRLMGALDQTLVLGLTTNLRFLRWLVRQPAVRAGEMRVDTLERIWPPEDLAEITAIPDEAWSVAARSLLYPEAAHEPGTPVAPSPWSGGWRLNAPRSALLSAEGIERRILLGPGGSGLDSGQAGARFESIVVGGDVIVDINGRSTTFGLAAPPDVDRAARAAAVHGSAGSQVIAPMPGTVLAVHANPGDSVEPGQAIVTLEAMKMEHVVVAPERGTIESIGVATGDQVSRGQLLAVIAG